MNTNSKVNSHSKRKQNHLDVCRNGMQWNVEGTILCGFDQLEFIHTALPELSFDEISTKISFLGKEISAPLFISCMTGGSAEGLQANRALAKAAQTCGIPLGLGSMRVAFEDPKRLSEFNMRKFAPDIPLLANIGAVQLRDMELSKIESGIDAIGADALVVHLNCGQELFQDQGDRDFRGLKQAIERCTDNLNIPVIVKETGFGIRPKLVKELLSLGVYMVDVAGAGGTNWILVEERSHQHTNSGAESFTGWGLPTPVLIDASHEFHGKILASGGLRTGIDLAKSLALGCVAGGMALPFIRKALEEGADGVCNEIELIVQTLKKTMLLTGCRTLEDLKHAPLIKSPYFNHYVSSLIKSDLN